MSIFEEPKIDCHAHVLDPAQFPYAADVAYKPSGQEVGTTAQLVQVMQTYGTRHALLVQPNSGYGSDNSCMLDAIARHPTLFKGVAIAPLDAETAALLDLRDQGIVGIALNPTFHGNAYYESAFGLMAKLAELDMFVQIQIERDQLAMFRPWIERIPVQVLIDHCGRPAPRDGLDNPAFETLLRLSDTGRVHVKLSGYAKFAGTAYPFEDTWPFLRALVGAFGLERCMWASDWPYLRAPDRQDYGQLLKLVEVLFPDIGERRQILWETPRRLFFGG
ncbi:putative TIM-barrel fold metal-dependent hydrolase [Rhizobium leguminosarum bv. trifolii WSM597]|uniref:Putative TIM-barrel fold metal-dependent hydrolase n=1 Tax=Rhizobium leguminosarum bv. trifolii WSM597 TaxID=754764 RepID=I9NJ70_RHILT|nr:amidohydrolase family protein [Rhizobium leguminosarum]EJB07999.1 putative TIM-barrel fold metal-dependent hydrolase [Rhizobium leguminosarum bv. trifolii WSM597]